MKLYIPAPTSFDYIFLNDTQHNINHFTIKTSIFIEAVLRDKKALEKRAFLILQASGYQKLKFTPALRISTDASYVPISVALDAPADVLSIPVSLINKCE